MIIQRLKIKNFRVFLGDQIIDFAKPGDKSITVLLGENQSGKTTLIHALRWCLYGVSPTMANPQDLLNHLAFGRAEINSEMEVEVQIIFEHNGVLYRAMRRHLFKKKDGGVQDPISQEFKLDETGGDNIPREVVNPDTRIKEILPPTLAPFFFFEGEAAKSWATSAGGEELKKGVEDCLDLTVLDRAVDHLDNLKSELRKERKALSTGSAEEIDVKIEELEASKKRKEEDLVIKRKEFSSAQRRKQKIEEELGTISETAPLIEEKNRLEEGKKSALKMMESIENDIYKFISEDGFLAFSSKSLIKVRTLMGEAYARDEIPARIKPGFVEELLKRGKCICAADLSEGTSNREALLKWNIGSGLAALSERLAVIDNKATDFENRRIRSFEGSECNFLKIRDKHAKAAADLDRIEGKLRDIEDKLKGKEWRAENIKELQAKRNEIDQDVIQLNFDINDILRDIGLEKYKGSEDSIINKIEELEKQAAKLQKENKRGNLLTERINISEKIQKSVKYLHQEWLIAVKNYLDTKAKYSYKTVGQLNRRVSVGDDFQLSVEIDRDNNGRWIKDSPSESNQGVVAICFISAFIELAKRLAEDPGAGRFFQGGQFPMVMDAPFSDWDKYFCETVSKHLADTVPQLVVITKSRDWPYAKSVLEQRVGKAYIVHFFGSQAANQEVDLIGQRVQYTSKDPEAMPEYSKISEVRI